MQRSPLNPSIKFAPFIINKKQISTKMLEKNLFSTRDFKNIRSRFSISMEKKLMKKIKKNIIIINLALGLILNFTSSKYPIENKLKLARDFYFFNK